MPAAQVDVKQRAIETPAFGAFLHLFYARERTDHIAAETLQHPLQFKRDEAFVLGEKIRGPASG